MNVYIIVLIFKELKELNFFFLNNLFMIIIMCSNLRLNLQ